MKCYQKTAAFVAVAAGLLAVPGTSWAAYVPPQRVSILNDDGPGLSSPDPEATGRAVLTLYPNARKVCYTYRWQKMEVRALFLHRRSTQQVVTKLYDEAPTTGPSVQGCATEVPEAQVREFIRYPKRFYVHASSYTGQEQISGVLHRPAT